MVAFVRYADRAGLAAPVPTCPGWTVRDLVAHMGAAHRSTAAMLRGAEPAAVSISGEPLEWLRDGAIELVEALTRTPQEFWLRRACHLTTLRAVDALAAALGRVPDPAETWIGIELAVDGIDEVLTGFATRPASGLRSDEDAVLLVAPADAPDWWMVRIGPHPVDARRGTGPRPQVPAADWELDGPVVGVYLTLWSRSAGPMSPEPWPSPPGADLTMTGPC